MSSIENSISGWCYGMTVPVPILNDTLVSANEKPFPFFELPAELRRQIYESVLKSSNIRLGPSKCGYLRNKLLRESTFAHLCTLLGTNSQMREEALEQIFATCRITVECCELLEVINRYGVQRFGQLRSIHIANIGCEANQCDAMAEPESLRHQVTGAEVLRRCGSNIKELAVSFAKCRRWPVDGSYTPDHLWNIFPQWKSLPEDISSGYPWSTTNAAADYTIAWPTVQAVLNLTGLDSFSLVRTMPECSHNLWRFGDDDDDEIPCLLSRSQDRPGLCVAEAAHSEMVEIVQARIRNAVVKIKTDSIENPEDSN